MPSSRRFSCSIAAVTLTVGVMIVPACDQPVDQTVTHVEVQPVAATIELAITGMTCESCVAAIEGTVARLNGVRSCTVDLESERASVVVDANVTTEDVVRVIQSMVGNQYDATPAGP